MIQNMLFVSGLSTFLQSLFGTRLPTVVGGSYTYMIPVMSVVQARRYSSYSDPYEVNCFFFMIILLLLLLLCSFPVYFVADLVHMVDIIRGSL